MPDSTPPIDVKLPQQCDPKLPPTDQELPLTVVVCSNNVTSICARSLGTREQLGPEDRLLLVLDMSDVSQFTKVARDLGPLGIDVILGGSPRGLSNARNVAIRAVETRYLVFIDDDVTINRTAINAFRAAFYAGNHIVGVRLVPAPDVKVFRWYISPSQLHYLGLHRSDAPGKTWGACMGFDLDFVRRHPTNFRSELGRQGTTLISGDDTTFISEMREHGACEHFLEEVHVYHHVATDRLKFCRILSRAFWQGRSEVRRFNACPGALKEWRRNMKGWRDNPVRICCLALLYLLMVLLGMVIESVLLTKPGTKSRTPWTGTQAVTDRN